MASLKTQKAANQSLAQPTSLPHSEESERAVLAAILLSPHVLPVVSGRLTEEDFYFERHQTIYKAMVEIQDQGSDIDLRTLQAQLELRGGFERVGGFGYLAGLELDLPDLGRVETYTEIVKERALRRSLVQSMTEVIAGCLDGGLNAEEGLAQAEESIFGIGGQATQKGFKPLAEVYETAVAAMEQRAGGMLGLVSGFYDLDQMTQGLVAGNLIIIAGRPGMGKTSFAVNLAQNVAIREGHSVGIFSLEMSREELAQRVLASESDLPFGNIRSGQLSPNQWERLYDTIRRTTQAPIHIDDSPNPSLLEIASKARRLQLEKGLKLLIVDYMQLMQAGGKYESRQLEIAAISRGLKQLAKELEIPVIALSQLSRNPEKRTGDHRPQLADLRESGSIEQDADIVAFVFREEIYNQEDPDLKGLAELIIAKHRNGATGTIDLVFVGENTSFRNLEHHHRDEPGF